MYGSDRPGDPVPLREQRTRPMREMYACWMVLSSPRWNRNANRPLRTRMVGGVGAGEEKPLATR